MILIIENFKYLIYKFINIIFGTIVKNPLFFLLFIVLKKIHFISLFLLPLIKYYYNNNTDLLIKVGFL